MTRGFLVRMGTEIVEVEADDFRLDNGVLAFYSDNLFRLAYAPGAWQAFSRKADDEQS